MQKADALTYRNQAVRREAILNTRAPSMRITPTSQSFQQPVVKRIVLQSCRGSYYDSR